MHGYWMNEWNFLNTEVFRLGLVSLWVLNVGFPGYGHAFFLISSQNGWLIVLPGMLSIHHSSNIFWTFPVFQKLLLLGTCISYLCCITYYLKPSSLKLPFHLLFLSIHGPEIQEWWQQTVLEYHHLKAWMGLGMLFPALCGHMAGAMASRTPIHTLMSWFSLLLVGLSLQVHRPFYSSILVS